MAARVEVARVACVGGGDTGCGRSTKNLSMYFLRIEKKIFRIAFSIPRSDWIHFSLFAPIKYYFTCFLYKRVFCINQLVRQGVRLAS